MLWEGLLFALVFSFHEHHRRDCAHPKIWYLLPEMKNEGKKLALKVIKTTTRTVIISRIIPAMFAQKKKKKLVCMHANVRACSLCARRCAALHSCNPCIFYWRCFRSRTLTVHLLFLALNRQMPVIFLMCHNPNECLCMQGTSCGYLAMKWKHNYTREVLLSLHFLSSSLFCARLLSGGPQFLRECTQGQPLSVSPSSSIFLALARTGTHVDSQHSL